MNQGPLIETRELTIQFGGHVAVDRVNLQVDSFTLKSIIGPNGAGKTTLFNLISGQYKPTAGKVIDVLIKAGILAEVGERKRDRLYRYEGYLRVLD